MNDLQLNFFACTVSALPVFFLLYIIINVITKRSSIIYLIGFIFTAISTEILKKSPYESIFNLQKYGDVCYRPKGAHDCDFFSMNGLERPKIRAMPSGHMSITTYFVVINILILLNYKNQTIKILGIIANVILLISMGWARIYKLCHNKFQVFFGTIYGTLIASFFYNCLK